MCQRFVPRQVRQIGEAGLAPVRAEDIDTIWEYPDLATMLRGLLSAGPAVKAIEVSGEERVRAAVTRAIAPYWQPSGSYRLKNTWRCLLTTT